MPTGINYSPDLAEIILYILEHMIYNKTSLHRGGT